MSHQRPVISDGMSQDPLLGLDDKASSLDRIMEWASGPIPS